MLESDPSRHLPHCEASFAENAFLLAPQVINKPVTARNSPTSFLPLTVSRRKGGRVSSRDAASAGLDRRRPRAANALLTMLT